MTVDRTDEEMERRIRYHRPNAEGIDRISEMRRHALEWARSVRQLVPEGRERAVAFTKIEEALMWANAGIARSPLFQEDGDDG